MRPHLRGVTALTLLESARSRPMSTSTLLSTIDPVGLATLLEGARWVRLDRGDHLALRGSRPGLCWLLLQGFVKEHAAHEDGTEALLGFRGPGDLTGEVAVVTGEPCHQDVTVLSNGEALAFPAHHVRQSASTTPGLQAALLRVVAARATAAEHTVARNTVCDTVERVALALVELAERWGVQDEDGLHVAIPLTQTELAAWIGASRETAAKALHRFRQAGALETSRRRVIVRDLSELRHAAGLGDQDVAATG